MPVVAARTTAVGLLLVVAVAVVAVVVVAAAELVVVKLESAAASLLDRRNMLLLRKPAAGLELALLEKLLVDVLLASAVELEEERQSAAGFVVLGPKMRMLVKTLGVDHEESFGICRLQGMARGP
jgi:Na+-transporting NADH:ubiquinone oxidoreductase subunit NqrC